MSDGRSSKAGGTMGNAFGGWRLVLAMVLLGGAVVPAAAQAPWQTTPPVQRHEGIMVGGAPGAPNFQRCVDVQIGSDNAFGCLNQQLRRQVDQVNPSLNLPPLDGRSPDTRIGHVNEAAVRQQYGSNYGQSV